MILTVAWPSPAALVLGWVGRPHGLAKSFMIRLGLVLGLSPCLSLLAAPAPAPAAQVQAQGRTVQTEAPAIALSHCAERLKAAFRSGDAGAIQAAVQDVELLRRTYDTLDVLPLVEAMALHARELGRQGDPAKGLKIIETVERWAPRYPMLLGTRVILLRQQGPQGYLWGIADVMDLTRIRLESPLFRWLWALQHLAWLRLMATLLLWGWTLALALRYRRVFCYLWEDPLRRGGMHPAVVAILGAFLVTCPVIFGLDPGIAAFLWLWILAPSLLPLEIKGTILVILLQLVHPALSVLEPMAALKPAGSIVALQTRPSPPSGDRALAQLGAEDRTFIEGWRQLEFQEWGRAEATFTALSRSHPDRAEVMNNLGVARYQLGNVAGAQKCFDEAASLAPDKAEILLNQSVVAFRQMDGPLGFAKQEDAHRVDPNAFSRILAANQARTEQRTFALPLPDSPARITRVAPASAGPNGASGGPAWTLPLLLSLVVPLAAFGAFVWRVRRSIAEAHPSQCTRCGDPFHTTDSPDAFVCSKCHHLFVLKDGLHGESRKKKVDEVAAFQQGNRWIHRILILVLPGTDLLFLGETQEGLLEFAFLCFALGIVFATGRSVRYPGEILADPASIWMPLGLTLLLILFLRSWLKFLPRKG
jgi:hypothetical protein